MGRDLSIFQIRKSPKRFGVHSNLGTNIYTYRPKLHTWNVFDALTPSYIAMFGSVQYTTAVAHRLLLEFELMSLTPPHVGLSLPLTDFNFGADFGDLCGDFGASFGFDADCGAVFGNSLTSLGIW